MRLGVLATTVAILAIATPAAANLGSCTGCNLGPYPYLCDQPASVDCSEVRGCGDACSDPPAQDCPIDTCSIDVCPGYGTATIPIGGPERDEKLFGILALEQGKLANIQVHKDDPDGAGPLGACDGPACHFGTNCNTSSENGPVGVLIVDEATFPPGTQIVAGKTRWRSKGGPAVVETVFSNDWVDPGGDKVCVQEGGRYRWCPPLLDGYPDDPAQCAAPGPIDALWDEKYGGGNALFARALIDIACAGTTPGCDQPADPSSGVIEPGCYTQLNTGSGPAEIEMKSGNYVFCTLNVSSNTRLEQEAGDAAPAVTIGVRNLSIGNGAEFFWTPPETFAWIPPSGGWAGDPPMLPTNVNVAVFGANASFSIGRRTKVNGTFFAPEVELGLGTDSALRGRFVAKRAIGQPGDFYCGCRAAGAACTQSSDCCSNSCSAGSCG